MKKVTLREYANLHKLSYFNVMKMEKNGDIKSVIEEVEGKEITYVLIDELEEQKVSEKIIEGSTKSLTLLEENKRLKEEIIRLKEALEKCNKRTILA